MSEKRISYLNRNFSDYKNALIEFSKKYYPQFSIDYDDASVGGWLIDINADVADNLSYHIDRVFQETNIDSANEISSLYALARSNGFKVPGPKGSMAEVEISCILPISKVGTEIEPDWTYAPIVRRGTKFTAGPQAFELLEDVDFRQQFDEDAYSDKTISPKLNSNGVVTAYTVTKLAVVVAGETKIFKKTISNSDIVPFMEVVLPDDGVMNVESVVVMEGTNIYSNPTYGQFYSYDEDICGKNGKNGTRFFEVDSLAQQQRWDVKTENNLPVRETYVYGDSTVASYQVTKGEWKTVNHKFITEYTDKGYLKIIFGSGLDSGCDSIDLDGASEFSKYVITRTIRNSNLGYLPNPGTTLFVLYRIGGGKASNVAEGAINTISYLNCEIGGANASVRDSVKRTLKVRNTTPSVSGKDMPTAQELKYLIKYNNSAQNRCITVKDYVSRVLMMPPKFGTPFRVSGTEENNKMMLYLLGLDNVGNLDATLPTMLVENVRDYLSGYRSINDYVEIKSGRIINLAFDVDVFIDKNYNKSDVVSAIINTIVDYMDINKHNIGDEIFVGDIKKEISKVDGVLNLISLRVFCVYGGSNYSSTMTSQETIGTSDRYEYDEGGAYVVEIDLDASDYVIFSGGEGMCEVKYPQKDIHIKIKTK